MQRLSGINEWLSRVLAVRLHREEPQTAAALKWLGIVSLSLFVTLMAVNLLNNNIKQALVYAVGILPILMALLLIQRNMLSLAGAVLAINLVFLVTWLATNGNGVYDPGVVAFPVILLVAGLIYRERFIAYLTVLILVCLGWLVFGAMYGWYQPNYPVRSNPQTFFIIGVMILAASNSVYLLVRSIHQSLVRAEQEIEARNKAEQDREKLIRELKSKNQELNRFAITVSHDLKTPLITMSGYPGYLKKDAQAGNYERMEKDIHQINEAAKQMGAFVDQILDLSRVGRIINPPADIPFANIVQESLQLAEGLLQARQIKVQVESDLPVVHVDRVRMVQVMQNLIANSVKFMGDQTSPCIDIGVIQVDGENVFFVKDNGIGIAAKHHQEVFEIFNKLDSKSDGSGVGLALVKPIIEVHGGKIWVESEPGKGAAFFFTLGQQQVKENS